MGLDKFVVGNRQCFQLDAVRLVLKTDLAMLVSFHAGMDSQYISF